MTQPVSILLCALGGEGGGVLANWLIDVARLADCPAQATSIPGVAQRTGATTYYLEIYPIQRTELAGRMPVLGLNPLPGRLDALVSSELLETARQIANGLASNDRTCVISSSSRTLTTAEKMVMGDGRQDDGALMGVIAENSLRHHVLDMARICQETGTLVSAVMLGAIAASGLLPFSRAHYESVLAGKSASAKASLRGFEMAYDHVSKQKEQAQYLEKVWSPSFSQSEPLSSEQDDNSDFNAQAQVPTQVLAEFPADMRKVLALAYNRVAQYQGQAYAQLLIERLRKIKQQETDGASNAASCPVTAESTRWLALWMAYDDIIQVAFLKSRAHRWQRVSEEVKLQEGELLKIYDHFKPGVPELAAMLPVSWAQALLKWDKQRIANGKSPWSMPIKLARHSVWGMLSLRFLSLLRVFRPYGHRYITEQALIEEWLSGIGRAFSVSPLLALEVARCGQLIKGYGSTNERGKENLLHILHTVCVPNSAKSVAEQISAVAQIRKAALQDEAGQQLDQTLMLHGAPARPIKAQPILWMKNPRLKSNP
jgi:indolepyruvate ferredoxin oxidoreductase beta subunit